MGPLPQTQEPGAACACASPWKKPGCRKPVLIEESVDSSFSSMIMANCKVNLMNGVNVLDESVEMQSAVAERDG